VAAVRGEITTTQALHLGILVKTVRQTRAGVAAQALTTATPTITPDTAVKVAPA
jgi:hypothetical protein